VIYSLQGAGKQNTDPNMNQVFPSNSNEYTHGNSGFEGVHFIHKLFWFYNDCWWFWYPFRSANPVPQSRTCVRYLHFTRIVPSTFFGRDSYCQRVPVSCYFP